MRKTEFYKFGKLQGDVITYADDGRILTKEHYEAGQPIDTRKYAVAPNHPLEGRWKYVKYRRCYDHGSAFATCIESTLLWTISSNGVLDTQFLSESQYRNWEQQTNWKYASTGSAGGVLELFQGETLVERDDIRWIGRNEFEGTVTFSPDPNLIGHRSRFVRE
jgi:antitoxin component YwqK of YwqJK toxin-antitoxin module